MKNAVEQRLFLKVTRIKTLVSPFDRLCDSCHDRPFDRLSIESTAEEQRKREKEE